MRLFIKMVRDILSRSLAQDEERGAFIYLPPFSENSPILLIPRRGTNNVRNSDLKDFWNRHEYYTENYVEEPLTDEIIAFYENRLGLKFPQSYIQLMKTQNGGHPKKSYWFNEYAKRNEINTIGLAGFFGIGSTSTTLYLENLEMNFGLMNGNIHEI